MTLKPLGLILTAGAMIVPLIWFPEIAKGRDGIALFSQYLGIWALIAMAIVQIIATRLPGVEAVFGGLDRSYILHKWLGIGAMVAILLHDTIDAEMRGLGQETVLVEIAETAGEISLYGLLILVVITIATFIPYHLWRWTHKFMGAFFVAGAFHYLAILKPFGNADPLGIYTGVFCILGILAFSYRLLPAGMRPTKRYEVAEIAPSGNALAVTMRPKGRAMRFRAGQFAFVSFNGEEPHPFTLSQGPQEDGSLRMTVAALGDYTSQLTKHAAPGTSVRVEGPYGHFERRPGKTPEIWVAGGIGITPFLAWASELAADEAPVDLIYCVRTADQAPHLDEIKARAAALPNLTLHVHASATQGRIDASKILDMTGASVSGLTVAFCGPEGLRKSLIKGFANKGLPQKRFKYEEFEIRSGIGLRAFSAYLLKRVTASA